MIVFPYVLDYLRRKEILMQQFGLEGNEATRRARDELFGIQNARKAYTGMLAGLQNPNTIAEKARREQKLLDAVKKNAALSELASAWDEVAEVQKEKREMLGETVSLRSRFFDLAMELVLLSAEDAKPNDQRLREYTDSGRESFLQNLLSTAPVYRDLEQAKLADEIARLVELRGGDDELVVKVLDGKGPRDRAAELIGGSKIDVVDERKSLVDGGQDAVNTSNDPMIHLALMLEDEYRRIRSKNENLEERERQAYAEITRAVTAIEGTGGYPDATFTLRLAFGVVKGYEQDGARIDPTTDFAGAYAHTESHKGQTDFDLPASWMKAKRPSRLEQAVELRLHRGHHRR